MIDCALDFNRSSKNSFVHLIRQRVDTAVSVSGVKSLATPQTIVSVHLNSFHKLVERVNVVTMQVVLLKSFSQALSLGQSLLDHGIVSLFACSRVSVYQFLSLLPQQ